MKRLSVLSVLSVLLASAISSTAAFASGTVVERLTNRNGDDIRVISAKLTSSHNGTRGCPSFEVVLAARKAALKHSSFSSIRFYVSSSGVRFDEVADPLIGPDGVEFELQPAEFGLGDDFEIVRTTGSIFTDAKNETCPDQNKPFQVELKPYVQYSQSGSHSGAIRVTQVWPSGKNTVLNGRR